MNNFTKLPSEAIYTEIGKRVAAARTAAGMTQLALAEALSLSRTSVTNIESGRQKLLVHTLLQLAAILQIDVMELLPRVESNASHWERAPSLEKLGEAERAFIEKTLKSETRGAT